MLADVDDRVTLRWSDLDHLVGGLPRSAYQYAAFWKGDRSGWRGFTTVDVRVGEQVTFVRQEAPRSSAPRRPITSTHRPQDAAGPAAVVLVGCVKTKLDHAAPARDLYTSALFRKQRAYAEASRLPWFVLSAEHGLVDPSRVIEPYELHLAATPRAYRAAWGRQVVADLSSALGGLDRRVVEIHAGAAYVDAIRSGLAAGGATVVEPLAGLTMGERLAWYAPVAPVGHRVVSAAATSDEIDRVLGRLRDHAAAVTPRELLLRGRTGLDRPGLYSWWVDDGGAEDLSRGLGERIAPGLIYAGLAGATRSRSGRPSTNTLWGRLHGMHLGSRHEFSTFRRSLGSILAEGSRTSQIDEERMTTWMHAHLRVIAVPVADADTLDVLETRVLADLDPPLNLAKMPKNAVRARLSQLRRVHSQRPDDPASSSGSAARERP